MHKSKSLVDKLGFFAHLNCETMCKVEILLTATQTFLVILCCLCHLYYKMQYGQKKLCFCYIILINLCLYGVKTIVPKLGTEDKTWTGKKRNIGTDTSNGKSFVLALKKVSVKNETMFLLHVLDCGSVIHSNLGSLERSGILDDSGHIAPLPHPDGKGSVLKHHTLRTLSLCSHTRILCTNILDMFILSV